MYVACYILHTLIMVKYFLSFLSFRNKKSVNIIQLHEFKITNLLEILRLWHTYIAIYQTAFRYMDQE